MPRAVKKSTTARRTTKKTQPLTLGDLAQKVPTIKTNTLLYVALLIAVFVSGYLYSRVQTLEKGGSTSVATTTSATTPAAQPKVSLAKVKEAFGKSVIKFGDTNKKLVIIEVADPSCPYCHIAGGEDPELNKQVGTQFTLKSDGGNYVAPVSEFKKLLDEGKISFSYIYYPGHGNGEMGMKALYCANEQGKFWEAHNLIMNNAGYNMLNNDVKNDTSKSQTIVDFLSGVVDSQALKSCIESGKYDAKLKTDSTLATDLQIQGTPGFYLNDTVFPGAYNYTDMESAVKKAGI